MALGESLEKLCAVSRTEYRSPYAAFAWPDAIDVTQWAMAPELLSLHGTRAFASLTERQQKRLSWFEAANFFSVTMDGEKQLAPLLYRERCRHLKDKPEPQRVLQFFATVLAFEMLTDVMNAPMGGRGLRMHRLRARSLDPRAHDRVRRRSRELAPRCMPPRR